MAKISTLLVFSLLAVCLIWAPLPVMAQETCPPSEWTQIVELSKEAKKLVNEDKFDDALKRLQAAFAICQEPKLYRSMGLVLEKAGRDTEALEQFQLCVNDKRVDLATRIECQDHVGMLEKTPVKAVVAVKDVPAENPVVVDKVVKPEPVVIQEVPVPAPVEVAKPDLILAAPAKPKAIGNWVGIGVGAVATGLGTAFLIQYGLDKSNARGAYCGTDGCYAADVVGPRNLALGVSFSVAGVAAVILSAVLWPKSKIKAAAAPVNGGGILALTVDL